MMLNLTKKIIERKNKVFSISNGTIISFILIVSTLSMPFAFMPQKANAQSIGGYASGLVPAIAALPQCGAGKLINSGIKSLFSGIGSLFSSSSGSEDPLADANSEIDKAVQTKTDQLESTASSLVDEANAVRVSIQGTQAAGEISDINANTKATRAATESLNDNSTCIQSIGRLIIKMLLQKLTVSTIAWINSGFNGSPAFIQDPSKFFGDIAKNEILQFGAEIKDPALFPFGKVWLQNTAAAFNSKFADNAKYSLDKLIQDTNPAYSGLTFQQDFSQGGWNAWTAMTQSPANNPLGFQLMADNELQKRLAGTTESTAQYTHEALQAANGFLGDQRCADPVGLTKQQNDAALVAGKKDASGNIIGICKEWQYVTPGALVANAATTAMGYQNNAYLNVQDLNDAVAAVTDALLSHFSSNIMANGFANVSNQGADGSLVLDTSSGTNTPYTSQTEQDFTPDQLTSSWLSSNPDFNIRTDLTQALIDEQRTYSDKLAEQDKELLSTTDGGAYNVNGGDYKFNDAAGTVVPVSNAYGLIPVIDQLDYCIPGPHPGWEADSQKALDAATSTVLPETQDSLKDKDMGAVIGMAQSILPLAGAAVGATVIAGWLVGAGIGATLGSAVPVVGTIIGAIVGVLVGYVVSLFSGSDDGLNVRTYYAFIIEDFTGYLPAYDKDNDTYTLNLSSKAGAVGVLNTILSRYAQIIDKIYYSDPEILPPIAQEAAQDYSQLSGYGAMIKNNQDKIESLKSTIDILGTIKDAVDKLNSQLSSEQITNDDYENQLKPQIAAFGRLSESMVNGDDIASADNLLKQIVDKKNYIYNNLLKGPYGCEAFLQDPANIKKFPSAGPGVVETDWSAYDVTSVKRMTYPFPILYDYNSIAKGANIPDPLNSGYVNTMPNMSTTDTGGGPGFLSFIHFSTENDGGNRRGSERLPIHDLVPQKSSGEMRFVPLGQPGGPFETIIGIY